LIRWRLPTGGRLVFLPGSTTKPLPEMLHYCLHNTMIESSETDLWQRIVRPDEGQASCFQLKSRIILSAGKSIEISTPGFLICHQGELRAWHNRCPHAGSPLDWLPGQFFSKSGEQLVCHTHGAHFDPLSGDCLSGPCPRGLYPLAIREADGAIYVPVTEQGIGSISPAEPGY